MDMELLEEMTNMDMKSILSFTSVFILMSSLSSGLELKHVYSRLRDPTGIIIHLMCCYGFLPMLAFFISLFLSLPAPQSIGLIIMSACPGGAFASVSCFLFGADIPLSIAMTTASTVLSFIFIAINVSLYIPIVSSDIVNDDNKDVNLDYKSLLVSVAVLLLAIVFGLFISHKKYKFLQKLLGWLGIVCVVSTCLCVGYNIFFGGTVSIFQTLSLPALIAPLLILIFSYVFGFGMTYFVQLPNEQTASIALQCGNPNTFLSISILYVTLNDPIQIEFALTMPVLFTLYGTVITMGIGLWLMNNKYIKSKNRNIEKFNNSIRNLMGKGKYLRQRVVNYDSDTSNYSQAMNEVKQKCKSLFSNVPESSMQPEKLMEYKYGNHYDDINNANGDNISDHDDDHHVGINDADEFQKPTKM